jgi:hypothetical protein
MGDAGGSGTAEQVLRALVSGAPLRSTARRVVVRLGSARAGDPSGVVLENRWSRRHDEGGIGQRAELTLEVWIPGSVDRRRKLIRLRRMPAQKAVTDQREYVDRATRHADPIAQGSS